MVDFRDLMSARSLPLLLIGVGAGLLARSMWRRQGVSSQYVMRLDEDLRDVHHEHIEPFHPDAPAGVSPTPESLVGQPQASRSAADSAEILSETIESGSGRVDGAPIINKPASVLTDEKEFPHGPH